mgnify:CR=1 FL=1
MYCIIVAGGGHATPAFGNIASGNYSTVGGGYDNMATARDATVGGGDYNDVTGYGSTVAGGHDCDVAGNFSDIAGGLSNYVGGCDDSCSAILGGCADTIEGVYSSITGGYHNKVTGDTSLAFGANCVVSGDVSSAFGRSVSVSDDYVAAFFTDSYQGMVGINEPGPTSTLHCDGSMATKFLRRSTDIDLSTGTLGEENFTILADAAIDVTLPNATTCVGRIYAIRNISGGTVTVDVDDTGNIDGDTDVDILAGEGIIVQSEGTSNNWWIIANFN